MRLRSIGKEAQKSAKIAARLAHWEALVRLRV
jgi:hypothetical protein